MAENVLQLNTDKTEALISAPEHVGPAVKQYLGSLSSAIKSSLRNLGVQMGQILSLDQHVNSLARSSLYHLRNIAKPRPVVSRAELEMIIHAFVSNRLDYCNSLFTCLNNTSLNHLQMVRNATAELLTKSPKRYHVTPILMSLHWLPVNFRIQLKILVIVYKALQGQAPSYIKELLKPNSTSSTLRSYDKDLLFLVQDSKVKETVLLRS